MIAAIRFASDLPLWVVLTTSVAMVAFVTAIYFRETRDLRSPYRWLLPSLRGLAVALVMLILAAPVWHRRQVIGTLGEVTFAVDVSQSMGVTDSSGGASSPSRLRRATALLDGGESEGGWIDRLRSTHEVEVVTFSGGPPQRIWTSRQPPEQLSLAEVAADGRTTDLTAALETPQAEGEPSTIGDGATTAGIRRRAVVLMTDGRDTAGRSAAEAASRLAQSATVVHTIGMGSEQEPDDVAIVRVEHPDSVAADGRLAGTIDIRHFGYQGKTVPLRIEAFYETVWQTSVTLGPDGRQSIPFQLDVEAIVDRWLSGAAPSVRRDLVVLDLRASVGPLGGEMSEVNNAQPFRVAASTRQRRLLILAGSSRWEIRYLRNLFDRDPRWHVDTILFGPGTDMPSLERGQEPGQFPSTREAMSRYDAVVVGEIPTDQLGTAGVYRLQDFVTRGGGLILIGGRYGRLGELSRGELGGLVPVRYAEGNPRQVVRFLQPTPAGIEHPVLSLAGRTDDLAEFWRQLPSPTAVSQVEAKEDAEVWAEAVGGDGQRLPWLVTRLFGAGRVFYLSSGETWRWRYKVADRFHARFWNQLVSAAMQPPYAASDEFVAIGTDRIEYESGQRGTVRVRLQDPAGEPVGGATVDALLTVDGRVVSTIPLSVDDPARGTYIGLTPPLESGSYELKVRASGFDSSALQASAPIWVGSAEAGEFLRISLDRDGLQQVAEAGGGAFFHESAADRLLAELEPLSSGRVIESEFAVWQSFYWFAAVLVPLALEWLLRKRAGLV